MKNTSKNFDTSHTSLVAHYIPRPRLDELFNRAFNSQLIYVIAGAGYGKTQAVRHYIEQQDAIARWVHLTENDNIASRYWENYTHSVSIDNPELATQLRELGFPETIIRFKQFKEILRLSEHRTTKTILVLDDFHSITSKEMLTFAERCAHAKIPNSCIIIISRETPEINTVSLLCGDKVFTITESELRFTSEEIAKLFCMREITFSSQDILKVFNETKGWALAINMLSFILKSVPNNFNHAFDTMKQNISKLFETEAWDDLSKAAQKTIVRLSMLSNIPIPLHEISDDTEFLQYTPKVASFMWFDSFTNDLKIHPLYLEFLQSKYSILSHKETQETYRRAAQWCSEHEFHTDAIYYYAKSHQYDLINQTLLSYPFKLPRDISEYFFDILKNLDISEEDQFNPHVLFLTKYFIPLLLVGAGRYDDARKESLSVIQEWEHVDTPLAAMLLYITYSILAFLDMHTCTVTHKYNAPEYLRKCVEYFKRSSTPPARASQKFKNADIRSFACVVGEGATLSEFDQFLETTRQSEFYIKQTPYNIYAGYADLVACECAFFKAQPDLAKKYAYDAIIKARESKQHSVVAMAEKYLLHIAMQDGDVMLTKNILKQLKMHLDNSNFWNRQLYYDLYIGMFYAKIGFPEKVPQTLIIKDKDMGSEINLPARELFVNALYCISSKNYHHALALLCTPYPRDPHERFLFGELRFSLLTAVARMHTGDTPGAIAEVEKAYELSFHGVFEMFFIELGKDLHSLIVAVREQSSSIIPEEWLEKVDRKASIYAKKTAVVSSVFKDENNVDDSASLSEREREVLLDLYHGLSREEIATNRYLSINTVKTILRSIFIKLDAYNSVDAIRIGLGKKLIK